MTQWETLLNTKRTSRGREFSKNRTRTLAKECRQNASQVIEWRITTLKEESVTL